MNSPDVSEPNSKSSLLRAYRLIEQLEAKLAAPRDVEAIAIVGIGCRFPGGVDDPESFWKLLRDGMDATRELPPDRWDRSLYYDPDDQADGKLYVDRGGYLDGDPALFDAEFFNIPPREACAMDPQHRLLLTVAWRALEDAGIPAEELRQSETGIYAGLMTNDYARLQVQRDCIRRDALYLGSGTGADFAAGRLSYVLGCQGPSMVVATACSSSLVAVHLASQSLRNGECDRALAGGVNQILSPDTAVMLSKMHALSRDGRSRSFAEGADGYGRGEGCGVVVLKRLTDAQADGDRIYAVIRGSATNHDGPSGGLTIPNGPAQEKLIRAALLRAGATPAQVAYVEGHGTGTALGDPIEVGVLGRIWSEAATEKLAIGSVKSNLGHLEAAAGVAGLIKTALALYHREIPPSLHCEKPNRHVDWNAIPVQVATRAIQWPQSRPLAGVSSFGLSGINAHVVMEAAPAESQAQPDAEPVELRSHRLLVLSAISERSCRTLAQRCAAFLASSDAVAWGRVAGAMSAGRSAMPYRCVVTAAGIDEASRLLRGLAQGEETARSRARQAPDARDFDGAFLFTGQGSQYPCMGLGLFESEPAFQQTLRRCDDLLRHMLPKPLLDVLFPIPGFASPIDDTRYTQPALFSLQVALAQLWKSWGIQPRAAFGHSVGELAAACVAGVFSLEDGLAFAAARGALMGSLPRHSSGMAMLFAPQAMVRAFLQQEGGVLSIATINGPEQIVISGALDALDRVLDRAAAAKVQARRLNVSHGFHSSAMDGILPELEQAASRIRFHTPRMPIVSGLTGRWATEGEFTTPEYWVRQARQPVEFASALHALAAEGCRRFIEIGPKPVLTQLGAMLLPERDFRWLPSLAAGRPDWETISQSVGELSLDGVRVDFKAFHRGMTKPLDGLPGNPFEEKRYWLPEASAIPPSASVAEQVHPLLGAALRSASEQRQFASWLGDDRNPWLRDHQVDGRAWLPATALWEMALAAGRQAMPHRQIELIDCMLEAPCLLEAEAPTEVQTILAPLTAEESFRVAISSWEAERSAWRRHATGTLRPVDSDDASTPGLKAVRERLTEPVDPENIYAEASRRGVAYGPSFRVVQEVYRGGREVLARVALDAGTAAADATIVHPALLDGVLQAAGVLLHARPERFVPQSIERLRISIPECAVLWAHVRETLPTDEGIHFDVALYSESGELAGSLTNFFVRPLRRASREVPAGMLSHVLWEPQQLERAANHRMLSPRELARAIDGEMARWRNEELVSSYARRCADLDRRAAWWIVSTLSALAGGWPEQLRGDTVELAERWGIVERHRRLLERILSILEEEDLLVRDGSAWVFGAAPEFAQPEAELGVACRLLDRCGAALGSVLRGETDPLPLLFPRDGGVDARRLYIEDMASMAANAALREAMRQLVNQLPAGRRLRVLEVGAGTGASTAHLLSVLPASRTEYWFTDISPYFTERAKRDYSDFPFVQTLPFDLEDDPLSQGLPGVGFDVIVAANVIHATRNVHASLTHLQKILAPGGLLLLAEGTAPSRWLDLIFGLTDGWWRFTDTDLRRYPLLPEASWLAELARSGFTASAVSAFGGQMLFAAAPEFAPASVDHLEDTHPAWIVFADRGGAGDRLTEQLKRLGHRAFKVFAGETYRRIDEDALELAGTSSSHLQLFSIEHLHGLPSLAGVVYLWPLDSDSSHAVDELCCLPLLQLFGQLLRGNRLARVFVGTRNAMQVLPRDDVAGWNQAPLWSLAGVATLEHPDLAATSIDLDEQSPEETASRILQEIVAASEERRVAYRGRVRYVARLAPLPADATIQLECPSAAYRLEAGPAGNLDRLHLVPLVRRAPDSGEVEIEIQASGLNFLDLLEGLDALPFERGWLGGECAGVVTAAGPDVTEFRAGDAVVALVRGAFATHAIADARLTAHKPARLSFAEAAAFPVAFLTAHLALDETAGIKSADRVLIHSISGGTGLAAFQLARRAGAEVFGTASPRKWERLNELGVDHLMHSRTLSFAAELPARTQGRGVDLVLNSLTGDFISAGLSALAPGGRFIEIGKTETLTQEQVAAVRPDVQYQQVDLFALVEREPKRAGEMLREFARRFENGELDPLPVETFPLEESVAAFRTMQQARHIGKIVLSAMPTHRSSAMRADASYLIAGGTSDLGLLTARWLATRGARHVILVARHEPSVDTKRRIAELRADGCAVKTIAADIADREALAGVFERIASEMPPLRGIVHAAGVTDDGLLAQMDWVRFERVLRPKMLGAWNLHELTLAIPLDFFVLYSSVASVFGSAGQSNHAAANRFLDSLVLARRRRGLPGLSINWAAWEHMGAAARRGEAALARSARMGQGSIQAEQAFTLFDRLWNEAEPVVAVAPIDWTRFEEHAAADPFFAKFRRIRTAASAKAHASPDLGELGSGELEQRLAQMVLAETRSVLGQGSDWIPEEEQGFFGFGMDSLTSLELRNRLQKLLGKTLPSTLLFDHASPRKLVAYLADLLRPAEATHAVETQPHSTGAPLDDVAAEEIAHLLEAQLAAMDSLEA
jgi:acyl transferase domain-containing protein